MKRLNGWLLGDLGALLGSHRALEVLLWLPANQTASNPSIQGSLEVLTQEGLGLIWDAERKFYRLIYFRRTEEARLPCKHANH